MLRFGTNSRYPLLLSLVFGWVVVALQPLLAGERLEDYALTWGNPSQEEAPSWLQFPRGVQTNFAQFSFQVIPPYVDGECLMLTVIFDDQPGALLRVFSSAPSGNQMLSENLMEGVTGTNQRRLLLTNLDPNVPTTVTLQSGSIVSPIRRLIWTWMKPQSVLAGDHQEHSLALRGSVILRDAELVGTPLPGPVVKFGWNYVSVPLQDKPEDISAGLTFIVVLDQLPTQVRLIGQLLTSQFGNRLTCSVNGQGVPDFNLLPPSLRDPSFFSATPQPYYAGWMPTGLYLPAKLWHLGDNLIELKPVDFDGKPTSSPTALKDTEFEALFNTGNPQR